jgi:hypothetical protein
MPLTSDADDPFYQSETACCPRQTIPDSCSCLEDCGCLCLDCDCTGWGRGGGGVTRNR